MADPRQLSHQLRGWHRCKKARDDTSGATGLPRPGETNVSSNSDPLRIQEAIKKDLLESTRTLYSISCNKNLKLYT